MSGVVVDPNASPVPMHSAAYRARRLMNWVPLGMTYATYYMGRYNLNAAKATIGSEFHLDKTQVGFIATAGFWTYAASVMFNGPLADRFGGKKAILIGAAGAALFNLIIGLLLLDGWHTNILVGLSLLYAANSYFQSFGALSVVKVNAPWFHVRERGVFSGIFGIMISCGYALALTVGGAVLGKWGLPFVFLVPSVALAVMFLVDWIIVRDRPSDAGFEEFDTGDASAGDDAPVDLSYLVKKLLQNPVIVRIAAAEFCTGFVRQGLLLYFLEYLLEVHHFNAKGGALWSLAFWANSAPTVGGIVGGLLCGWLSDRFFDSRRPPVAFIFYIGQIVTLLLLGVAPSAPVAAFLIGLACTWIFGVHGMLSGTASMDFGGRKAAASAAGLLDGVQYIASGLTGFGLGWIIDHGGWAWWTRSLIPFSFIGGSIMLTLWNEKPRRTHASEPATPEIAPDGAT